MWKNILPSKEVKKKFLQSIAVIFCVSLCTILLTAIGWLRGFENTALDTWLRLAKPIHSNDIVIVYIDDKDYKDIFSNKSPLDASQLKSLIETVAKGQPKVIGVDIDTEDTKIDFSESVRGDMNWPHIVWARRALANDEKLELLPVLGEEHPSIVTGLALMEQDPDGVVRSYRRVYHHEQGAIDTLPWAIINSVKGKREALKDEEDEIRILNFSTSRYSFKEISATNIMSQKDSSGWENSVLHDKIVLIGGYYRAAGDRYLSPSGSIPGVKFMAQAVQNELEGKGIKYANELVMIGLEILLGIVLVLVDINLGMRVALYTSIIAIFIIAPICSFIFFATSALWGNFVAIIVAVLIHQLYDHAKHYQHLSQEMSELRTSA